MTSPRRKGTQVEREFQQILDDHNIVNLRVAGSGSRSNAFCDVVCWSPGGVLFVEVKYRRDGSVPIKFPYDLNDAVRCVNNTICRREATDLLSPARWVIAIRRHGSRDFGFYDEAMWHSYGGPDYIRVTDHFFSQLRSFAYFWPDKFTG